MILAHKAKQLQCQWRLQQTWWRISVRFQRWYSCSLL